MKALSPHLAAASFSLLVLDFTSNHKRLLVSSLEYESLVTYLVIHIKGKIRINF